MQFAAPMPDSVPAQQSVQVAAEIAALAADFLPATQLVQPELATFSEYFPGRQSWHEAEDVAVV